MPEIDLNSLSGAERAAILLVCLGEEVSGELFKGLTEEEVKAVSQAISNLGIVNSDLATEILEESHRELSGGTNIHGNLDYVTKVIQSAFSPDVAADILRTVSLESASNSQGLAMLRKSDPRQLANLLQNEHPQTVALVISNLNDTGRFRKFPSMRAMGQSRCPPGEDSATRKLNDRGQSRLSVNGKVDSSPSVLISSYIRHGVQRSFNCSGTTEHRSAE